MEEQIRTEESVLLNPQPHSDSVVVNFEDMSNRLQQNQQQEEVNLNVAVPSNENNDGGVVQNNNVGVAENINEATNGNNV